MRSQSGNDQRLGSDSVRRGLLCKIQQAVDSSQAPQPPSFVFPSRAPPDMPSIAVGNAIDLVDSIRIFEQYARVVSNACRGGNSQMAQFLSGDTLPPQLASWFEPLRARVRSPHHLKGTLERQLAMFRRNEGRHSEAPDASGTAEEYYEMQRTLPFIDLGLVRHMLSMGRPESTEYEARISSNILRLYRELSWEEHLQKLDAWREAGALHPLLLAASCMPSLNDWLPVDMHSDVAAWGDILTAVNGATYVEHIHEALVSLDRRVDWGSPAGLAISGLLDCVCVAMRVLSNSKAGDSGSLDEALGMFPDWSGATLNDIWKGARGALESNLPPCVLCPRMSGFRRGTWGYQSLTPFYDGQSVRIVERKLEWVEPPTQAAESSQANSLSKQTGFRLQDVLCRMGEIALSPEIGHAMMLALDGLRFLHTGSASITQNEQGYCHSPALLLHFMSDGSRLASDKEDVDNFIGELFARLPEVKCVHSPVHIVGWRVDPPQRVIIFTGKIPGRRLDTALLDERSCVSSVGGIFLVPDAGGRTKRESVDRTWGVRRAMSGDMLQCLRGLLRDPPMETLRVDDNRQHTHTILHEGLGEMALCEPLLHTTVPLHSSMRWDNEREDTRYSETQAGSNGRRVRDWIAVHRDTIHPQKCRLDSHSVVVEQYYTTMFPWRKDDGTTVWVDVASSVKPEVRVLPLRRRTNGSRPDPLSGLLTSIKARFLQDLKLLPVRDASHRTERTNTTVYVDRQRNQILVCYAPTGDSESRIEFMAFGLRSD